MPALGYWYTLIFFKNPVLALIYHTLIYHNACNSKMAIGTYVGNSQNTAELQKILLYL